MNNQLRAASVHACVLATLFTAIACSSVPEGGASKDATTNAIGDKDAHVDTVISINEDFSMSASDARYLTGKETLWQRANFCEKYSDISNFESTVVDAGQSDHVPYSVPVERVRRGAFAVATVNGKALHCEGEFTLQAWFNPNKMPASELAERDAAVSRVVGLRTLEIAPAAFAPMVFPKYDLLAGDGVVRALVFYTGSRGFHPETPADNLAAIDKVLRAANFTASVERFGARYTRMFGSVEGVFDVVGDTDIETGATDYDAIIEYRPEDLNFTYPAETKGYLTPDTYQVLYGYGIAQAACNFALNSDVPHPDCGKPSPVLHRPTGENSTEDASALQAVIGIMAGVDTKASWNDIMAGLDGLQVENVRDGSGVPK